MALKRFSIGLFNLFNLVLPNVVYYNNKKYKDAEYLEKKRWLADQLIHMNADLVGFQEVFHAAALQEVVNASNQYTNASIIVGNETGNSPRVALVSRFPIVSHKVIADFPGSAILTIENKPFEIKAFSRPVIQATVQIDSVHGPVELIVFVVHLKSKRPIFRGQDVDKDDPLEVAWGQALALVTRATEATALRYILVETMRNNKKPVILMGDINDNVHAVTSEIISGTAPYRYLPQNKKAAIWDILLNNVKDIQARVSYQDFYYTHIFNGFYESLDHIFVNDEFVRSNPGCVGFVEYVKILNDHLIDETLSHEEVSKTRSDHGQVVATIKFREPGMGIMME
ncbi:MAG: endonuclease/exonuclease/phosphatase family protein [bacterium]